MTAFLSRREFARLVAAGAAGLALPGRAAGALRPADRTVNYGLFFGSEAIPVLAERYRTDPLFAGLRTRLAGVDRAAERRFLAQEVRYNDHLFHIARVADLAPRMALLYVLTGDEDAGALSLEAVRTLMRFPKWDYFLEAGKDVIGLQRAPAGVMAVSLAADWLGGLVPADERAAWLRTMGERGNEASFRSIYGMRYPDRVVGWTMDPTSTYLEHRPGDVIDLSNWPHILDRTNLKAVPTSALVVGALAFEKQFGRDERVERWMEQGLYSLRTLAGLYTRDGSYDEGVNYAHYTSLHLAQATEALRRHRGLDLYDMVNWPGYVRFQREMMLPTADDPHATVNFGDAWGGTPSSVYFWIARRSHDERAQWFGETLAADHDEWSLIWHDPALPAEPAPAGPHLWRSELDWTVARTGYRPDDLVVAMRSGPPSNHEHADRNSLIVKAFGEILVADPRRPPYSYSDPAWMMRTTAGHSALLIDGKGHQYHDGREGTNASRAAAHVVRTGEAQDAIWWTSDATPAYALVDEDVRSVTRTLLVLHELPAVVVLDKVLKRSRPSRLQARFFAYGYDGQASVEADGEGFHIRRPRAGLAGVAHAAGGARAGAERPPIPEETARLNPFAEVSTGEARPDPFLITVLLPHRDGQAPSAAVRPGPDGSYDVEIRHAGGTRRLRVFDTGEIPEIDLAP